MHRNYWLKEIKIKEAVALLTTLLNDEFKNDVPNPKEWLSLIEDLVDAIYGGDTIVLDELTQYEIVCHLDDYGLIDRLEFVKRWIL